MEQYTSNTFKQIGDLSYDVYFVFDISKNRFEYLNPSLVKLTGFNPETVIGSPGLLAGLIHAEDKSYVHEQYHAACKSHIESKFEFRIIVADGTLKYVRLTLFPLPENDKTCLIAGIAEDITVLKNNIFYAEKINARKNSTLEILAHDLKGPIGVVNMMASSIQREAEISGNKNILDAVKVIQDLCNRNIQLIRELISQEFLESREVELRKERVDLVWAINDVIDNYKKSADIISKQFKLNSSAKKIFVKIDTLKLIQVFNNLISNAMKFTAANGMIEVDVQDQRSSVQITISDNGIGIPEELHPYLFDKFTRARRPGLQGEESVGLGMSIIKTIVELHGGDIWFDSKENEGSTFYIKIPK
ncbi:PAS domain-containing protein [Pedobacter sp. HMF7647]|uniref:histidine kinase n=1 Tax=Hufsiella arboris TaxID=2695275 RepID=A0A7K1Y7M3_9SPHI|nr:PAS domain-containing sensor histidine kinase [Hufsiella arboris]MXV50575.1 PAS domain-containing protein [Hufsiella arboris]